MGEFRSGWQWGELLTLVAVALLLVVLWRVPGLDVLLYPLVLFKTFVHEFWHGLAAWLTGGEFLHFEIYADTSGLAWTRGGWAWVIASAGYLGASFTGALLLIAAARGFPAAWLLAGLGIGLLLLSVLLGGNAFGRVVGLGLSAVLLLAAIYLRPALRDALLLLLACSLALDALNSLLVLTALSLERETHTDAVTMAQLTGLPPLFWAVLWIAASVAMLVLALRIAYRRPIAQRTRAQGDKLSS